MCSRTRGNGGTSPLPSSSTPTASTPARRQSGRLLSKSTPSSSTARTPSTAGKTKAKRVLFTDLEDVAILEWLAIGINASSFLKGIKTDVFKEIATHLEKQKVSPRGVLRTWTAVKSRLTAMLKKYYTALRKKQQTGWGADRGEKTIKGAQLDLSLLSSLSIELSEM